jgi:hypothetical protein
VSPNADTPSDRARDFHRLFLERRIDHQLRFYTDRSAEYRAAHRQVVIVRNVLLGVAAVAGGLGPFLRDLRGVLGLVAAVLAALATAVTAFETLIGFPQLEKLYGDAARNLEEAALDWRGVDPATSDLTGEVERVEDVFRSERGQWGQLLVTSAKPPALPPAPGTPPAPSPPAPSPPAASPPPGAPPGPPAAP